MSSPSPDSVAQSRTTPGWLVLGGILSIVVGFFAIAAPQVFSFVLTQLLGALCLVSGVVSLSMTLFGKEREHRVLSALSGIIRIAAGSALLFYPIAGTATLTLILAVFFLSEGVACIVMSLRMRANPAWIWLLLNGVTALILGGMVYVRWPNDSAWVIGLLYGIQSLFSGATLLMLGLSRPGPEK